MGKIKLYPVKNNFRVGATSFRVGTTKLYPGKIIFGAGKKRFGMGATNFRVGTITFYRTSTGLLAYKTTLCHRLSPSPTRLLYGKLLIIIGATQLFIGILHYFYFSGFVLKLYGLADVY